MKLSLPILGVALVVGLLISFIQAVTQINEATLAFLPKILAIGLALVMLGSFMTTTLNAFSHRVFDRIVTIGGS
jgi:flagellar biosynthetic protein FliQ